MSNDFGKHEHKADKAKDESKPVAGKTTFGAATDAPGSNPDPTKVPDHNDGLVVTGGDGKGTTPGIADPNPDFSSVPALPAFPEPFVPTPPDVTKDSSADARGAGSVPVVGWVDHNAIDSNGNLFPVHTHGVVLYKHATDADGDRSAPGGQAIPDASTMATPTNPSGSPTVAEAQAPARADKHAHAKHAK